MPELTAKEVLLETLSSLTGDKADMVGGLPSLEEFVRAFGSSTFVCAMFPLPPTPPVEYPGADGLTRAWADWSETFESIRVEPEELREGDAAVVLLAEQIAVTRHDGVAIRQPSAMTFLFDRNRIARIEFHLDRKAALTAGGL